MTRVETGKRPNPDIICKYVVVLFDDETKGYWMDHDVYGFTADDKETALKTLETLGTLGKEASMVELPEGHQVLRYDWDIWLAVALAHRVPMDLAILGREVYRESYQHQWDVKLQEECGWPDKGRKMIKRVLEKPDKAEKRWRKLMDTEGLRHPA